MNRNIIIALLLGGALIFILRVIQQFFGGISGTRSEAIKDLKELDQVVDGFELAPWDHNELDLISRKHDGAAQTGMYATIEKGQFYSIYHEPIMAFAIKEYVNNDRKLAVVKFNNKKYHFNSSGREVQLSKNGKPFGRVSIEDGVNIELGGKKLHIDSESSSGLIPLTIDDEHKLSIAAADEHTGTQGRMLHKVHDHDNAESELILVSIAFALANKQI